MNIYLTDVWNVEDFNPRKQIFIKSSYYDIMSLIRDSVESHKEFYIPKEEEILEKIGEKIKQDFIDLMKKKEYKVLNNKEFRIINLGLTDNI